MWATCMITNGFFSVFYKQILLDTIKETLVLDFARNNNTFYLINTADFRLAVDL